MTQDKQQNKFQIPHQTFLKFNQNVSEPIFFNSKFDSGNLHKVNRNSQDHFSIWTAVDAQGTENQGYPKSWFHFEVGQYLDKQITFSIHRVHFLWSIIKKPQIYRPVYKIFYQQSQSEWQRLPHPIESLTLNKQQQLILKFHFNFQKQMKTVRFAFLYPYSYEQQRKDILRLKQIYQLNQDKQIFFKQYQMIKTYQKRIVDMIIISSHQGKQGYQNIKFDQYMDFGQKLIKFRDNKPIIFISSRVHPIETPSSFCMNGIIKFLLDKKDYRAHLLRKYFVFILVPMLNPDGVSNGHCRMDQLNQNLNRHYKNPDPVKQPSCYAVRKLCQYYQKDKRMFMYLDLHAHPAPKGNFMFGNAIYDFIEQVQSQLFPKILSQNCINFQFENSIFSRKHMKAKDRFQDMNKQGCGRVVLYKDFGIPHAYTLQCGYHSNSYNNKIQDQKNKQNKYLVRFKTLKNGQKIYQNYQRLQKKSLAEIKNNNNLNNNNEIIKNQGKLNKKNEYQKQNNESMRTQGSQINQQNQYEKKISKIQDIKALKRISNSTFCNVPLISQNQKNSNLNNSGFGYSIFQYTQSYLDNLQDSYYKRDICLYNIESYQNLGRNILISILDIFNKNPYSRSIDLNQRRRQIAEKKSKLNRFRKQQAGIRTKMKNIVDLIEEQIYSQWHKKNVFNHVQTTPLYNRVSRNKNQQFKITQSVQNNQAKILLNQRMKQRIKKQTVHQAQILKKQFQNNNQNEQCLLLTFDPILQKNQQKNKNIYLGKRLISIKTLKQKNISKQKQIKNQIREQILKRLMPLPSSQNIIQTQKQLIKSLKSDNMSNSSKVIKSSPPYTLGNLRTRTLLMQGNNVINYTGTIHNLK